ncbi:hypothetical protein [Nitrosomonas nitrosa]|uniref:hypothetical protein n=1 Tax=Nitrosomonas nitrosa TaxID=52442 RepID=UPI0023F878AD|nr:hypothetical protein [Nitrosomonas nitrosa]MCO6433019.1 hypothetical protein [Nitrosomonas nitrosa]
MLRIMFFVFCIGFTSAGHADKQKEETRIYQTDSLGTVQADRPHFIIQKDGRVLPTDSIGTRDSTNPNQYRIIGDRIYETDSLGTIKHDKSMKIKQQ